MLDFIKYIGQFLLLLVFCYSLFHWVRVGFWVPRFLHYLASFAFLMAVWLYYLTYSTGDPNANVLLYILVGFPLSVYLIYGVYGGGIASIDINLNDALVMDRAMLQSEVISIYQRYFEPYTKWTFENLLFMSSRDDGYSHEIKGDSGKLYILEVEAEVREETNERIVTIYGKLLEKRKFYCPKSHVYYEIGSTGNVYMNGLRLD